jgi:multiple sugar transport system ATP-binding protein
MATLELKGVEKYFGHNKVIHATNLSVQDGELVVFVGPSGCGKSTLLRMIAGLETLTRGEIHIDGQRIDFQPPSNRGIAMVFQSYALYPHKDVRGNLGFSLKHDKVDKREIERRVNIAADILGLQELMNRKPRELSGGQRQRVAIGRAIVREPKVFLFDEPLSNLDAALRVHMRVELLKLHHRLQNTMLYVTHDQVEAMTLADRIVVFQAGRVEQIGTPLELYRTPINRFVAGFIGSPAMNFLDAICKGGTVTLDGKPACHCAQPEGKVTLGVRPEHLYVDEQGPYRGSVQVFEHLGGEAFVHLTLDGGQALVARLDGEHQFRPGDTCSLGAAPDKCHVFNADGLRVSC